MAYTKVTARVGVPADRAAAMAKDPVLLDHWFDEITVATVGADRTHWAVANGKHPIEFEVLRVPTGDKRLIRWRSLSGPRHVGAVRVHDDGPRASKLIVEVAWAENGPHAGALRRRIKAALRDFRYEAERLPEPG